MDLKEFPKLAIDKFGVHNINPLLDHFTSTDSTYLDSFRKAVADAGSHIVDLGLSGGSFYSSDGKEREQAVKASRGCIDVAAIIGSPSVRQHVHGKRGEKPSIDLAAQSLGQLAEHGGKHHVVINLENDNPISEDPFFLTDVIDKVNSPHLRALPDFGNSLIAHDPDYNQRGVAAMLKHAYNMCHVKDVVRSSTGQEKTVDLKKMFALAKGSSYRGYFSMEFDSGSGDPFAGTTRLVNETLGYLNT
jgi:sugar phosphate isomerase/epimerase